MTIGIEVDRLAQAVANANRYGNPNVEFSARLLRARAKGDPCRDFAHGTLDAVFVLPEGTFTLRIRWEAEGQSKVEHGWICREAPHLSGGGIFSDAPILDGDSVPLSADADELVGLAYEFFSCQEIESAITPVLPVRPEGEYAGTSFRPWHGRRKRCGR